MEESVIITFANQEGCVGKTTLCAIFAIYLAVRRLPVIVVDCDPERGLLLRRQDDLGRYATGDAGIPYDILPFDLSSDKALSAFVGNIRKAGCVALCDAPGNLRQQGLVTLFANSDYIVCPFRYDRATLPATATFVAFIQELKKSLGKKMKTRMFFVANRHEAYKDAGRESQLWEQAKETLGRYGIVTPTISMRADMERLSTLSELDEQLDITRDAFDSIYNEIFDV